MSYRARLPVYDGPIDLLLYLIRKDEVDIEEVEITEVIRQYLEFLDLMSTFELEPAADFLVVAATLVEIKSEAILPRPPEEQQQQENPADPRMELVRQLLMYKRFKDAAELLDDARDLYENRFPRPAQDLPGADPTAQDADLTELEVWDLLKAFARVMEDVGTRGPAAHEVEYLDTPIEVHAEQVRGRLEREGPLSLYQLIEGITLRREIIGVFLSLLELVKQRFIIIEQLGPFGQIRVRLRPLDEQGLSSASIGAGPLQESAAEPEAAPEEIEYAAPAAVGQTFLSADLKDDRQECLSHPMVSAGQPFPSVEAEGSAAVEIAAPTAAGYDDIDTDLLDDEIDKIVIPVLDFAELRK